MQRMKLVGVHSICWLLALGAMAPFSAAEETPAKPDFALRDTNGTTHRLSDYRGKWVVLEWVNYACPSVKVLYGAPTRTLPTLQQAATSRGVVWFSINSTAPGQRGHVTPQQGNAALSTHGARPTALLLDATGAAGKAFGVNVTPEVRVISPQGSVVYAGGVRSADATSPRPYLRQVLDAATGGTAIPFATQPAQGSRIAYAGTTSAPASPSATGPKAPDFSLPDNQGMTRRLRDYRGKWVILEWVNYDCPFVKKHYAASHRNMQKLQARAAQHGIVWLCICSSSPGKQGHLTRAQVAARLQRLGASPAAYLHDPAGTVGRAYRARTTPGMRVISPQGTVEYAGGIDDIRSMRPQDVLRARNFVALAIADIVAGRPIAIKQSRSYGCSVKY